MLKNMLRIDPLRKMLWLPSYREVNVKENMHQTTLEINVRLD